jgi:hypothetical protein
MCVDRDIQELLPVYLEQGLDETAKLRVESHLGSCADCRTEIKLLRMMAAEPVPDPGEAFWEAMPERIYRDVQKMQEKNLRFDISSFWDRVLLPPWVWGVAAAGLVLVVSLLIIKPAPKETSTTVSNGDESSFAESVLADTDSPGLTELSQTELENVSLWADSELSSLSNEIIDVLTSAPERDIHEELLDLNPQEIERLSRKLEEWEQEA